jgi:glyoxylate utilization-related uncharacterized protein
MTNFVYGKRYIDKTNEGHYIFDSPCCEDEFKGNFTDINQFFLFSKYYDNMTAVPEALMPAERYIDNYKTDDEGVRWVKLAHVTPHIEQLHEAEAEIKRLKKLVGGLKRLASSIANDFDKLLGQQR